MTKLTMHTHINEIDVDEIEKCKENRRKNKRN